jgi:lipoprotein-releasing system permease protein
MFNKLTWYIAYKYLSSSKENGFASFISIISILGVTLGIAVLIIVLSVLNGFKHHIEYSLLQDRYHLNINYNTTDNITATINNIKSTDNTIKQVYPLISEQGLLKLKGSILPVNIVSEPVYDSELNQELLNSTEINNQNEYDIFVSEKLVMDFNLDIGDKLIIAAPILKTSVLGPQPRFKKFKVTGLINKHDHIQLDNADIMMPYNTILKFFEYPDNYISGLYLYSEAPLLADQTKQILKQQKLFDSGTKITTWQESNQTLFQAIRLERISIVILLLIIITVACFNILSGLFIQVSEKRKDIAILQTLGITRSKITSIFIIQAILIAVIGGVAGTLFGCMLTQYLDSLVFWLQGFGLINTDNSFFNAIANHAISIKVNYNEVSAVFGMSLILCLLASIIPALKSSKIIPAEALRDE